MFQSNSLFRKSKLIIALVASTLWLTIGCAQPTTSENPKGAGGSTSSAQPGNPSIKETVRNVKKSVDDVQDKAKQHNDRLQNMLDDMNK